MSEDATEGKGVPSLYERLAARFEPGEHKTKTIGGNGLTYVDGETVVSRLNEVLGYDGWSFEVKDIKVLEDEVWALGRMTVYSGERSIVREQAGGQIINRTRGIPARPAQEADEDRPYVPAQPAVKGQIIEINNDIKGAITDCLKKCATLVGVGLYLYDPDERAEVKAEMAAAKRNPTPPRPAASTAAAGRGSQASPSASTPTVPPVKPISSSTAGTPAETTPEVHAAAQLTGAPARPKTTQEWWAELVAEAERAMLPTLRNVKAISPKDCPEAQLRRHCERLSARLAELKAGAA